MMSLFAKKTIKLKFFLYLFILIFFSCRKRDNIDPLEIKSELLKFSQASSTNFDNFFYNLVNTCNNISGKIRSHPTIFALNINQSLLKGNRNDISSFLLNEYADPICPPGPFLLENGAQGEAKTWFLGRVPDYIVWLKDTDSSQREKIYITDQMGNPIKSKVYSFRSGTAAMEIISIDENLKVDVDYYLYIKKQEQNDFLQILRIPAEQTI